MSVDIVVKNAKLVSPRMITEAGVAVNKGKIISISRDINLPKGNITIDAEGKYILPGILDLSSSLVVLDLTGLRPLMVR
jgi:dihydroorotase